MDKGEEGISCSVTPGENQPDKAFWNAQWESRNTGWDIGHASAAIKEYMAQYPNKKAAILIPGCGNAYEAEYLVANDFTNITLIDIAPKAVELLNAKFAGTPQVKIVCGDFFQHQGNYDLIIEQTFFCAISPGKRKAYAEKTASLLNRNGKIAGVLFNITFEKQGPPFGGSSGEYKSVFEPCFDIKTMDKCYNSIPPRTASEVFIILVKKP